MWLFCAQRFAGIAGILEQVATRLDSFDPQPLRHALDLSRQAAALHFQEHAEQAQILFEQALAQAPHMIELNMAAARLFLDQLHQQQANAEQRLQDCLQRIEHISNIEPESIDFAYMQSSLELSPW